MGGARLTLTTLLRLGAVLIFLETRRPRHGRLRTSRLGAQWCASSCSQSPSRGASWALGSSSCAPCSATTMTRRRWERVRQVRPDICASRMSSAPSHERKGKGHTGRMTAGVSRQREGACDVAAPSRCLPSICGAAARPGRSPAGCAPSLQTVPVATCSGAVVDCGRNCIGAA